MGYPDAPFIATWKTRLQFLQRVPFQPLLDQCMVFSPSTSHLLVSHKNTYDSAPLCSTHTAYICTTYYILLRSYIDHCSTYCFAVWALNIVCLFFQFFLVWGNVFPQSYWEILVWISGTHVQLKPQSWSIMLCFWFHEHIELQHSTTGS